MLWLALHLPRLSLEAFCATLPPEAAARPVALLAEHHVVQVNAAAAARGLRPGLQRATALALAAELLAAEADPARDAVALRAVAHAALAFTPAVSLHDPRTLVLELAASLRLFGGLAALREKLTAALAPLGHRVQMAAAPTALGAALLAQWQPAQAGDLVLGAHATQLPALRTLLDAAPLALLQAGHEHGATLQGLGLHTLGELQALPRDGLARRFGAELVEALDRALGRRPDPRRWLTAPEVFDSRLELFTRADRAEQVLHGAAVLLGRLVAWAQARHARIGGLVLRMRHEPQRGAAVPATELALALAEPSTDAAHLQLLLRERLARCPLAAPTLDLQLQCRQLVAGTPPSGELFPTPAVQAEGLGRLLERLCARLGDERVLRLEAVADHRPERASRLVPVAAAAATASPCSAPTLPPADADPGAALASILLPGLPLHRPAWLLPAPQPLAERDARPLLRGRPLHLLAGPERIETGWWDGPPVARDYFIAQADDGALVWLCRDRLPGTDGAPGWGLQGWFG